MPAVPDLSGLVKLATQAFGKAGDLPPLLVAHGLYGSGRNWGVIAKRLADERHVITVDMRNHGASPWSDSHRYPELAADLAEVIDDIGAPADLLGHSMGGKAAMVLALTQQKLVRKLVVADIAPVAYEGLDLGPIVAMRGVDLGRVERRSDAAEQMHGINEELKPFLLHSLDLKEKRWCLNLDVLAADMAAIRGFPALQAHYAAPVLMLSGSQSDYVLASHRAEIKRLFPAARFARIPSAGHWLHAEKPREVEAAIRAFLNA